MIELTPPAGTTRYLCPLECGWHHDDPPPSPEDVRDVAPDPDVRNFQEAVSSIAGKAAMRRLEQTETALKQHLATHTAPAEVAAIEQLLADKGLAGVNWRP
ncbi:hypothetical protein M2155_000612 [Streptomyces sp. SAI-119]|uniref:hypothetical protein n=1 Tax=Streptomyces sp. SAI-119 TaxID=2940541 RepID=UPI0024740E1B|nr:hypothetical protein [Streptomyces sp. SAI-119]MDH6448204.1 hypothetical protein [Streptomyces sp. SAI-119]